MINQMHDIWVKTKWTQTDPARRHRNLHNFSGEKQMDVIDVKITSHKQNSIMLSAPKKIRTTDTFNVHKKIMKVKGRYL